MLYWCRFNCHFRVYFNCCLTVIALYGLVSIILSNPFTAKMQISSTFYIFYNSKWNQHLRQFLKKLYNYNEGSLKNIYIVLAYISARRYQ